jgi:hypothetical protein
LSSFQRKPGSSPAWTGLASMPMFAGHDGLDDRHPFWWSCPEDRSGPQNDRAGQDLSNTRASTASHTIARSLDRMRPAGSAVELTKPAAQVNNYRFELRPSPALFRSRLCSFGTPVDSCKETSCSTEGLRPGHWLRGFSRRHGRAFKSGVRRAVECQLRKIGFSR